MALSDDINHHIATLKSVAGASITYTQGVTTQTITAALGQYEQSDEDATGLTVNVHRRHFIIDVDDLTVTPSRGDQITYDGETWEVMGETDDGPAYTFTDQFSTAYRVRTELVSGI